MADETNNPLAFSRPVGSYTVNNTVYHNDCQQGMSLRDYFAGKALTCWAIDSDDKMDNEFVAERCYEIADAMLKARSS